MFKWNVSADAEEEFNINKSLNENWDKIDAFASQADEDISDIKAEQEEQNDNIETNKNEIESIKQENVLLRSQIPQGSSEGEYITVKDSSNLPFDEFLVEGNSVQDTRDGRNYFDASKINNANVQVLDNGKTIKMPIATSGNGYTTTQKALKGLCPNLKVGDIVTLRFNRNLGYAHNNCIYLQGNINAAWRVNEEKTITQEMLNDTVIIYGNSYNNGETEQVILTDFSIMKSAETDTTWEQYGVMPSTEFPSPIRNCGDDVNLFNKDTATDGKYINDEGILKPQETATVSDYIEIKINKDFYVSGKKSTWVSYALYDKDKTFLSRSLTTTPNGILKVTNTNCKYIRINLSLEDKDTLKLQEGTVATPYSPYNQGTINIGKCNKNMCPKLVKGVKLNSTNGIEQSGNLWATTDYIPVDFNKNPNYYISGLVNTLSSFVASYNSKKEFLGRTGGVSRNSILLNKNNLFEGGTPQGTGDIAYLRLTQYEVTGVSVGTIDDIDNAQIQLEPGNTATSYVQHKSETITFPLAEGQVLHKDDYLADDGIHQKRGHAVVNSNNMTTLSNGNKALVCSLPNKVHKGNNTIISSRAIVNSTRQSGTVYENPANIVFIGTPEDTLETLQAKYNGSIVEYELAQEQIIPYTAEQKKVYKQLLNSGTYKNVTNIYSLDEIKPSFKVKYRKDLETLLLKGGE